MTGNITSNPITEPLKAICLKKLTGTLVVSNNAVVKELLFDKGLFAGALSTDPSEDFGEWLVSIGKLSPADLDAAVLRDPSRQLLGQVLVEMQFFDATQIGEYQALHSQESFCSIFNWESGQFDFKEGNIFLDESQRLSLPIPNLIFQAIQRITSPELIHRGLKGNNRLIRLSSGSEARAIEIDLKPEEAFILSRIDSSISIAEIMQLSPLGLDKTERTLYGFLSAGIIEFVTQNQANSRTFTPPASGAYRSTEPLPAPPPEEDTENQLSTQEINEVKSDVFLMLEAAKVKTYYEFLNIPPAASADEIKKSYYTLAKKYHPDRYHHSTKGEIKEALETIFSTLSQAYETLKVPATRTSYDAKIFKLDSPTLTPEKQTPSGSSAAGFGQQKLAELNYRQGRGYYEQEDYWNSVQAFRQSVRLEPSNGRYRYWLGMALTKNPKWRREAEEHFLKAIEIDQFKAEYCAGLGNLYKEVGMARRAQGQFNRALQLEPDNQTALEGLGSLPSTGKKKLPALATLKNLFGIKK
jgi:curved DNA-binding protein CbpA